MASPGAGPELLTPLPPVLAPGAGLLLPLAGRARGARAVALRAGPGPWVPAEAYGVGRDDLFWGLVPVGSDSGDAQIAARVRTRSGTVETDLARVAVTPHEVSSPAGDPARIAIVLPTHEPDAVLLEAQVASLRAQTHTDWVCVIDDDASSPAGLARVRAAVAGDARFVVRAHRERAGVYRNVERALDDIPAGAGLVALCDQDDRWDSQKLSRLAAALAADRGVTLAHHDLRITDAAGSVLAESAWTDRARSEDRLRDLVTANTVTGSAALWRREVLRDALPFPVPLGPDAFHDHWIALAAAATGRIAWVGAPLGDYVQHAGNVLGHRPRRGARSAAPWPERWAASYADVLLWRQSLAGTLLLRCADRMTARDRRELTRTAAGPRAPLTLAGRALAGTGRRRRTLDHEWRALRGALWLAQARRRADPAGLQQAVGGLRSPAWPTASSWSPPPSSG